MENKETVSNDKLRGGYYTPPQIAHFLLRWALRDMQTASILEPSCGDGAFIKALIDGGFKYRRLDAIEYIEEEANKAASIKGKGVKVTCSDFHHFCLNSDLKYNLVVGNPPYIRYQFYEESQKALAKTIIESAGLKFSKMINAWVPFVIGACQHLKKHGRLAFVIPTDFLQVSYAKQLRDYILQSFAQTTVVTFNTIVFEGIQQDVILLLCDDFGCTSGHQLRFCNLNNNSDLEGLDINAIGVNTRIHTNGDDKWTSFSITDEEKGLIESLNERIEHHIGDYARVEVGITTGDNKYFTVSKSTVDLFGLHPFCRPMVGRSVQVDGAIFSVRDWEANVAKDTRAHLLVFDSQKAEFSSKGVQDYIAKGVSDEVNKRYKTRIRDEWYVVPSIKLSDALFIRRNNVCPKLILNSAGAYTTDTMHRVFIRSGVILDAFVASYYNSLSLACCELYGRSFGGGVLEIMPSEVQKVILPYSPDNASLLPVIDKALKDGEGIERILDITDQLILVERYGLSQSDVATIRNVWRKMSQRRLNR